MSETIRGIVASGRAYSVNNVWPGMEHLYPESGVCLVPVADDVPPNGVVAAVRRVGVDLAGLTPSSRWRRKSPVPWLGTEPFGERCSARSRGGCPHGPRVGLCQFPEHMQVDPAQRHGSPPVAGHHVIQA